MKVFSNAIYPPRKDVSPQPPSSGFAIARVSHPLPDEAKASNGNGDAGGRETRV